MGRVCVRHQSEDEVKGFPQVIIKRPEGIEGYEALAAVQLAWCYRR